MKQLMCVTVLFLCGWMGFAQQAPIPFRVTSYLISTGGGRKQTASQYERAELYIHDETQSWEIVLYRKDAADPERVTLEKLADFGKTAAFRTITIQERAGKSGGGLFAYMPPFEEVKAPNGGRTLRLQVDLCDTRTEAVRRRIILEY